jgi:hypothetical protein
MGILMHDCHSSYVGKLNRREDSGPSQPVYKFKNLSEKQLKQKGLVT